MKRFFRICALLLTVFLTGCSGTPVVCYDPCDCPDAVQPQPDPEPDTTEIPLKTGLAVVTSIADSQNAAQGDFQVTLAALTVDDSGVIQSCVLDGISTQVTFDASGAITGGVSDSVLSKNELGDDYGMKTYGGAKFEWYQQAAAFARYVQGKTVEEVKRYGVNTEGMASDPDLATSATIYLGDFLQAIEQAAAGAQHLGAQQGDELRLASLSSTAASVSASAENPGAAQLDTDVTALTIRDDVITSCVIDSLQAQVAFDTSGTITTDVTQPVLTKNQLGDDYGMVAYGGAKYEWYQQAASFAKYVTGMTAREVSGITVDQGKAAQADLLSSVTIRITGFQALVVKACE